MKDWVEKRRGDSYGTLLEYIEKVKPKNPRSIYSCISQNSNGTQLFKSLFILFKEMIAGFLRGCKPFIRVDGCFLKWSYKGVFDCYGTRWIQ